MKSLRGIALSMSQVEARGLRFDRRWMVVDEHGEMLTQRKFPQMAQIETRVDEVLTLTRDEQSIQIPLQSDGARKTVRVWRDSVKARDCGIEAANFLSEILGISASLVWMPESSKRRVDDDHAGENAITSFSDGFPFLILGQNTLGDLNDRLEERGAEPVEMSRFRPNFVFRGGDPLDEDTWARFQIGAVEFEAVKPCSRCVITTIDQTSGDKCGPEPIATLSTYRKMGAATYLGQNVLARSLGEVEVGMEIRVLTRRPTFLF